MDASPCDFDMETCVNGHTFCNDHAPESEPMTPAQYRESIKTQIGECTWLTKEKREADIAEMEMVSDDEIEDYYNDNYSDDGVPECQCPICSFKALDKDDGFKYLKKKFSMKDNEILEAIKVHFKTYKEFQNFLNNETKKN
jgi:hypothetical protein